MRALFLRGESYWQKRIWHECLCINSHTISTSLSIHSTSKNPMAVWDLPRVLCFRVIKVMPFYQKTFFIKISYISDGLINEKDILKKCNHDFEGMYVETILDPNASVVLAKKVRSSSRNEKYLYSLGIWHRVHSSPSFPISIWKNCKKRLGIYWH